MNRKQYLETAMDVICAQRRTVHGTPESTFTLIATYWSLYLTHRVGTKVSVTPADVAMMMSLFKTARFQSNPQHQDNLIDNLGYVALAGELIDNDPLTEPE